MGSANPWRVLFPLARNWRVLGACYSLWVIFLLHGQWASNRIGSGWIWVSVFTSPLAHIGAFAFLAPLPWILPRRLPPPWNFILGFILSGLICESASALLPALDAWLLVRGGVQFNLAKLIQLYTSLVGPAMMIVGGLVAARAHSEELRMASEAEAQIAKNRLLQGQVHPHVLFNALNGLAELVHRDPQAAEDAIRHLSDLLRRILQASEHMSLPLREERKIVADYLALEAIRLGDRLRVRWEWDGALDAIELPPLLFQPLVENAIKHGIAPSVSGGELVLRARAEGRMIRLEVWNSGAPFRESGGRGGIGVRNLRSRLSLHFGPEAELLLGPAEQGTLASIRFEATQVDFLNETAEGPGRR